MSKMQTDREQRKQSGGKSSAMNGGVLGFPYWGLVQILRLMYLEDGRDFSPVTMCSRLAGSKELCRVPYQPWVPDFSSISYVC